jgi:ribose 1,5-bisphosphokinase PhnN
MASRRRIAVIAGPHGAGKDSLADAAISHLGNVQRVRRVTTRLITTAEYELGQYEHLERAEFVRLEHRGGVIIPRHYPEASTGIRVDEIVRALSSVALLVTCNFEEGQELTRWATASKFDVTPVFVSPVSESDLWSNEQAYLDELRRRMRNRSRASDDIELRLNVARKYRSDLLADPLKEWIVLSNERGAQDAAVAALIALISQKS